MPCTRIKLQRCINLKDLELYNQLSLRLANIHETVSSKNAGKADGQDGGLHAMAVADNGLGAEERLCDRYLSSLIPSTSRSILALTGEGPHAEDVEGLAVGTLTHAQSEGEGDGEGGRRDIFVSRYRSVEMMLGVTPQDVDSEGFLGNSNSLVTTCDVRLYHCRAYERRIAT